jgi:hypothetical protein
MKFNKISISIILVAAMMLASCEEVIHLDLKNSEPRTVIDATLNASTGTCMVRATKSAGFYDDGNYSMIGGAVVTLVTGSGELKDLPEISPGVYQKENLSVTPGEILQLDVVTGSGARFTAVTKVPYAIFLDSLKVVRGFGDPRPTSPPIFLVKPIWKDPAGIPNYYRFKVSTNGKTQQGSFSITSDEQFDGKEVDMPLYRYGFAMGDSIRLEFQSIDSISYAYFNQINDMARPSFVSATPYNPVGNFNNGALGYFGTYFSEIRETVVSTGR